MELKAKFRKAINFSLHDDFNGASKYAVLINFFICVFFFLSHLLGYGIKFDNSDDRVMNEIAIGAFKGDPRYLVFVGFIYGAVIDFLNGLVPSVNWYVIIYLIITFASVASICLICTKKMHFSLSVVFTCMFNWLVATSAYTHLQYTKVTSVTAVAGFVILYYSLIHHDEHKFLWIFGILLTGIAASIRWIACEMIMPYAFALFASFFLKKRTKRQVLYLLFLILMTASLQLAIRMIDKSAYMSAEWQNYDSYNSARSSLLDCGVPSYEKFQKEYDSLGITELDRRIFATWMYNDSGHFTLEKLLAWRNIDSSVISGSFSLRIFARTIKNLCDTLRKYSLVRFAFLFLFLIVLLLKGKEKIIPFVFMGLVVAMYYYFASINRTIWRVEFGIWVAVVSMLTVYCFESETMHLPKVSCPNFDFGIRFDLGAGRLISKLDFSMVNTKGFSLRDLRVVLLCFALLMMCGKFYLAMKMRLSGKSVDVAKNPYVLLQFAEKTSGDGNTYIISGMTPEFQSEQINVFSLTRAAYKDRLQNVVPDGGWLIPLPFYNGMPQFPSLLSDENVLYAGNEYFASLVLDYLRENYEMNATMRQIDEIEGVPVWKYSVRTFNEMPLNRDNILAFYGNFYSDIWQQ